MIQTVYILCFLLMAWIAIEDFKFRMINWISIPLICLLLLIKSVSVIGFNESLKIILSNSLFVIIQLALLTLYFFIRNKKLEWIVDRYIGLGDVLFLLAITPAFSLLNYLLFVVVSIFLIIILYTSFYLLKRAVDPQIPLAGLLAVFFSVWMLAEIIWLDNLSFINLTNYFVQR